MAHGKSLPRSLLALALGGTAGHAAGPYDLPPEDQKEAPFKVAGILNLRYARTSQQRGWILGGTNKLRYGGRDIDKNGSGDRDSHVLAVPQASLMVDAPVLENGNAHLQVNLDADTDSGDATAGLTEIYLQHGKDLSGSNSVDLQGGAFFPPISWEHVDKGWSTRYTLTPSAIGSWITEEARATTVQGRWRLSRGNHSARLTAGLFGGADEAGWILLERGWSLHDYQPRLNSTLAMPGAKTGKPFQEKDGRLGFYARADTGLGNDLLRLGAGYWDNNGNPNAQDATRGASFGTQFWDVGGALNWGRFTVISQYLAGRTAAVTFSRRDWEAWYTLASCERRGWTLSGRYDGFRVGGAWERGYALTAALQWDLTLRQRLSLEYVHARAQPTTALRPASEKDQILQFNYRVRFGA